MISMVYDEMIEENKSYSIYSSNTAEIVEDRMQRGRQKLSRLA